MKNSNGGLTMQQPDYNDAKEETRIELSLKEVATILIQHYNFHEGLFDLSVEFQIGIGGVGPSKETLMPGATVGVSKLGLITAKTFGPTTVDAAVVNPDPKSVKEFAAKSLSKKAKLNK